MPSSSLQALLARAATALERGRGAEATQMLAPALKSTLPRDDELALRAMLAEVFERYRRPIVVAETGTEGDGTQTGPDDGFHDGRWKRA